MGHYERFDATAYHTHMRALSWLQPGERVLEVGCSSGALTERISQAGCRVVGIENRPEAAALARRFAERVLLGDVETMPLDLGPQGFDTVLLLDVLEHLVDPASAIRRILPAVRHGGRVIAAIPNVAHWAVRCHLLLGRFDYKETGILDRTHLHFYTIESARRLLEEGGLKVMQEDIVPDVPMLRYKSRMAGLNYKVARLLPGLFATESLFVAQPSRGSSSP